MRTALKPMKSVWQAANIGRDEQAATIASKQQTSA
jgi:hypothetical protein